MFHTSGMVVVEVKTCEVDETVVPAVCCCEGACESTVPDTRLCAATVLVTCAIVRLLVVAVVVVVGFVPGGNSRLRAVIFSVFDIVSNGLRIEFTLSIHF
jgi:hypothetical protein